jgi:hypothetical protein
MKNVVRIAPTSSQDVDVCEHERNLKQQQRPHLDPTISILHGHVDVGGRKKRRDVDVGEGLQIYEQEERIAAQLQDM